MSAVDPAGPFGAMAAAALGAGLGWLLAAIAGGWIAAYECEIGEREPAEDRRSPGQSRGIVVTGVVVAVLLWWWEVRCLGQMPIDSSGVSTPVDRNGIAVRWFAHVLLFWWLAAATWIDLRFRVIPDWVTIPGVLAGLVATWAIPSVLLPVEVEVPRAFAAPLVVGDVLGWAGPLARFVVEADWGGRPAPFFLAAGLAMFAVWWGIATAPGMPEDGAAEACRPQFGHPHAPATGLRRIIDACGGFSLPRVALLAGGAMAIIAAWAQGGERFAALYTALVGVVVSGGIVWATRAGASAALGREAMGLGDVTLMAMVGAWLGWQACVLASFVGVLLGLVHGVVQIIRHRENELPFGPSLCGGAVAVIVGWRSVWGASAESFSQPGQLATVVGSVVLGTALSLWVWSRLGVAARRVALAAVLILTLGLLAWLLLLGPVPAV